MSNWIAGAIKHPGALHRELGVPQGQKIPAQKLASAQHSNNPTLRRRANFAKELGSFHGRAFGGPVAPGQTVKVGEQRPELMTAGSGGAKVFPRVPGKLRPGGHHPHAKRGLKLGGTGHMGGPSDDMVMEHILGGLGGGTPDKTGPAGASAWKMGY